MTKQRSTKRALLMSALSLLLCVSMLVGSTFAWFTDEVKSGTNVIAAGNLDVELTHADKGTNGEFKPVNEGVVLFDDVKLWEPGAVAYEKLTVSNAGDLALKYQLAINVANAKGVEHTDGKIYTLADVLKVAVVDADKLTGREAAIAEGEGKWKSLASWVENGKLYAEGDVTGASAKTYGVVIYWEPTDNDDIFNLNNGKTTTDGGKQLTIELGVHLTATQLMHEEDSYGDDYDANANPLSWDGTADTQWYDAAETEYILYTAEELAGLSALVYGGNNFAGKTVKLGADINLANRAWTPIGRMINTSGVGENSTFKGNFDGQGYTVYNLNVDTVDGIAGNDENKGAGLFGAVTGSITNLHVENANIVTAHWAGVIAGNIEGSISKCSVKNVTVTCLPELIGTQWDNGDKAGAIAGYATKGSITGCTVTNAQITGYRDMGAIVGASYNSVSDCAVSEVTLIKDSTHDYKGAADDTTVNKYIGTAYGGATADATGEVTIIYATTFTVNNDAELAAALASKDTYVVIDLAADVAWSYPARSAYAGADTKSVKINGNGYTLTLKQTDSDWSSIGLANAEGSLTLNDLNIVKAAHAGNNAWNNHAVNFTCKVEMNNVTFDNSVNLKADATLKNVTITDAKGDFYGLIVTAEGQTVTANGLTITSGRAIKVMDQYVSAPAKVTIDISNAKFTTNKKAAVLVTSTAGADIIIGENVDISGCTADTRYEVWVDEERAAALSKVTVKGGSKKLEGSEGVTSKSALDAAINNAGDGEIVVLEDNVEYGNTYLTISKNITIDLGGHTYTSSFNNATINLKNGASIKNGTIVSTTPVSAVRVMGSGSSIEGVVINVTAIADRVVTGIAITDGNYVEAIRNVTISGVSQGIELGKGARVDLIENANVTAVSNGTDTRFNRVANGIALVVNSGSVGKAVNCTFNGEVYGVDMLLSGEFTVALELVDCDVTGGTAGIYAHDEVGISNTTNCSLTLTYDADTTITGDLKWEFEDECKSVVTLNKPN